MSPAQTYLRKDAELIQPFHLLPPRHSSLCKPLFQVFQVPLTSLIPQLVAWLHTKQVTMLPPRKPVFEGLPCSARPRDKG